MENPIPFNPLTMTLDQASQACDTLRALFDMLARDASADDVKAYLEIAHHYHKKSGG